MSVNRLSQMRADSTRVPPIPWAIVEKVTGAASLVTYTDSAGVTWRAAQWTTNQPLGLILATPGLIDTFVIGGGSGGIAAAHGGGGRVRDGLRLLLAGIHAVVIGAAGAAGGDGTAARGGVSSLGSLSTGGSWCESAAGTPNYSGLATSIMGVADDYGRGNSAPRANHGDGGTAPAGAGSDGCVMARWPL